MMHNYTSEGSSEHWAAATDGFGAVLVKIGDYQGEQLRIPLTPEQAKAFGTALTAAAENALSQEKPTGRKLPPP